MKRSNRFDRVAFEEKIETLLVSLQIPFKDLTAYSIAFFHRSALNEYELSRSNERIEFLGDAVLELVTTDFLYRKYPDANEGKLTDIRSALVRGRNLADIALRIGLSEHILLSKGEMQAEGNLNPYILANTFESLLGCIYMDLGISEATKFVHTYVISTLEDILKESLHVDPKSHLQEIIQAKHAITPRYDLLSEIGADHDKMYEIGVYLGEKHIGTGTGSSKKKAQSVAAENALQRMSEWG